MIANLMGGDGLIFLVIALVVLVGGSQLPKLARNVGLAGREFRKAQQEAEEEEAQKRGSQATSEPAPAALPLAAPVAPAAPVANVTPNPVTPADAATEPSITLTASQLDALLRARQEQAGGSAGG